MQRGHYDVEQRHKTAIKKTVTISLQEKFWSMQQSDYEIVGKFGFESRTHRNKH